MDNLDHFSFSEERFLAAQTQWDSLSNPDHRLQSLAAACPSLVNASELLRKYGPEIGQQIIAICGLLKEVFTSVNNYVNFLGYRGKEAQDLLDTLQKLLDHAPLNPQFRSVLYVAFVRLCRKSELCPRSFTLQGVNKDGKGPLYGGHFGDVYTAQYRGERSSDVVCIKRVKVYTGEGDKNESFDDKRRKAHKAFYREAVVWSQLSHVNVVPFYGICLLNKKLYLVSPRIQNGSVVHYLKDKTQANRSHLIFGVVAGMEYLHQNGVAHGDLKCENVLVAEPEQALLTDFGFSYVKDVTDSIGLKNSLLSSQHAPGGTWVFEAPERVREDLNKPRRNGASDVFAFGMLCLEMFTLGVRGYNIGLVHHRIVYNSLVPEQPQVHPSLGLNDNMWAIMKKCWSPRPSDRPTATKIMQQLPPTRHQGDYVSRMIRPGFQTDDATVARAYHHLRALNI